MNRPALSYAVAVAPAAPMFGPMLAAIAPPLLMGAAACVVIDWLLADDKPKAGAPPRELAVESATKAAGEAPARAHATTAATARTRTDAHAPAPRPPELMPAAVAPMAARRPKGGRVTLATLTDVFQRGARALTKAEAVKVLTGEPYRVPQSTAYHVLRAGGRFAARLEARLDGRLHWRG